MKHSLLLSLLLLSLSIPATAQQTAPNRGEEYMQQAAANLEQKEYIKARYLYLKAYEYYINQSDYAKAVACGMQGSYLYRRENYFKNAYDICNALDYWVQQGEKKSGKKMPDLLFRVNRERLTLAVTQHRAEAARSYLTLLEGNAKAMPESEATNEELLFAQVNYYYSFGHAAEGDECFNKLTAGYQQKGEYDKVDGVYKNLISLAGRAANTSLLITTYDKYVAWTASVTRLKAQQEIDALKAQQAESQQIISEKEAELSTRWYFVIGLCILAAVLIGLLILCGMVLLRYIALTRKQKKAIAIANEHNELKTHFIRNISAQVEPTLNLLDPSQPGVQALREFSTHIQELSDLEITLSEPYELSDISVAPFCDNVMDKIKHRVKTGVSTSVNAPKLTVRSNPEELEHILLHLLKNAAEYTPEGGKIWLDYKKRGAHVQQFIISDTGSGIPEDMRADLFRPFTHVKDLTQGDGLGLPICSLMAVKLNGSLTLDTSYTRGSRFVLELRT